MTQAQSPTPTIAANSRAPALSPTAARKVRFPVDLLERMRRSKRRSLRLLVLINLMPAFLGFLVGVTVVLYYTAQLNRSHPGSHPAVWPPAWVFAAIPVGFILLFALVLLPSQIRTARHSRTIVLTGLRARRATALEEQRMHNALSEVAIAAGVPAPMLLVIDERAPNALVVGPPSAPTVVVTTGLLELLGRPQIEAVASHLLARVIDGDIRYQTNIAAMLVRMDSVLLSSKKTMLTGAAYISRVVARQLSGSASRERIYLADDVGVRLARNPAGLIEALQAIEADTCEKSSLPRKIAPLFFVDPFCYSKSLRKVGNLVYRPTPPRKEPESHPPIAGRIARIRELGV